MIQAESAESRLQSVAEDAETAARSLGDALLRERQRSEQLETRLCAAKDEAAKGAQDAEQARAEVDRSRVKIHPTGAHTCFRTTNDDPRYTRALSSFSDVAPLLFRSFFHFGAGFLHTVAFARASFELSRTFRVYGF